MIKFADRVSSLIVELGVIIDEIESNPDLAFSLSPEDYYIFLDCVKAYLWYTSVDQAAS